MRKVEALSSVDKSLLDICGGKWSKTPQLNTFDRKIDVAKMRFRPDQKLCRRKKTLSNYRKVSSKKRMGAPCWVETNQQWSHSFHQKTNWLNLSKIWHKFKKRKDPKEKKAPKKDSIMSSRENGAIRTVNKSLLQICGGKNLRIDTILKNFWIKNRCFEDAFSTRPKVF